MQDSAVIRLSNRDPLWFLPGGAAGARPLEEPAEKEALRNWSRQHRQGPVVAVPGAACTAHTIRFEAAERKHILRSLPYALEEHLGEDVDGLHVVATNAAESELAALVCRQSDMENWLSPLDRIPYARRCLPDYLLLPWQEGQWTVLIEDEQLLVRQSRDRGFAVELSLAKCFLEAAQADNDTPETVVVYHQMAREDIHWLPDEWLERVQWRKGDFASALLLAQDNTSDLNLLKGDYAPQLPLKKWWRQWRPVALLLGVAFVTQLATIALESRQLSAQNLELRGAIEKRFRTVFPQGRMQDPQKQLQRKLATLSGSSGSDSYTRLLFAVGEAVSAQSGARLLSVNYNARGGDMRFSLLAPDYEAVEALRAAMSKAGLSAVLESSNAQNEGVRARMRVKVQ